MLRLPRSIMVANTRHFSREDQVVRPCAIGDVRDDGRYEIVDPTCPHRFDRGITENDSILR